MSLHKETRQGLSCGAGIVQGSSGSGGDSDGDESSDNGGSNIIGLITGVLGSSSGVSTNISYYGPFINYVRMILPIYDPPTPM